MATFTVFATWYGSETVLGASSSFVEEGVLGIIEDPLGAALGLMIAGLFFARPFYRLKLLTIGDFYKVYFGPVAEKIAALCMTFSFFGWIAAQMIAMGLVFHVVTGVDERMAIIFSSFIVLAYTFLGGMWAVSLTDFIQTIVIIAGTIFAVMQVVPQAGGWSGLTENRPDDFFNFTPRGGGLEWAEYVAAWITLGIGSIPSQDIYQRVMSSKSENVAVNSAMLAGFMYLTFGMLPLILGLAATRIVTEQVGDPQLLLPTLIMGHTSFWVQVMFFGALISAIMSTASGATLAPSSVLSENLIRPLLNRQLTDRQFLWLNRFSVLFVTLVSLYMALSGEKITELVSEASAVGLVSLLVPTIAGLHFQSRNGLAAVVSMISGLLVWYFTAHIQPTEIPAAFYGLGTSLLAFILVALIFPRASTEPPSVH